MTLGLDSSVDSSVSVKGSELCTKQAKQVPSIAVRRGHMAANAPLGMMNNLNVAIISTKLYFLLEGKWTGQRIGNEETAHLS